MNLLILLILNIFIIKDSSCIMCYCNENDCSEHINSGDCEADYCYVKKLLPHLPPDKYGCITTRQDLTDFGCEQNYKGGVTCICKEDYCNTEKLATTSLIEHKSTVRCSVVTTQQHQSMAPEDKPICRGAYCVYEEQYTVNKFNDYKSYDVAKRCSFKSDSMREQITSLSGLNWMIDLNEDACAIIHYSYGASKICKCSAEYCNDKPAFDVKIGPKTCYLYSTSKNEPLSYCKGDYCFWQRSGGRSDYERGCMSVATDKRTPLKTYKTVIGLQETYICDLDYCNGEPLTKIENTKLIWISFTFAILFYDLK